MPVYEFRVRRNRSYRCYDTELATIRIEAATVEDAEQALEDVINGEGSVEASEIEDDLDWDVVDSDTDDSDTGEFERDTSHAPVELSGNPDVDFTAPPPEPADEDEDDDVASEPATRIADELTYTGTAQGEFAAIVRMSELPAYANDNI